MNIAERKIFAAHKKAGSYCGQGMAPTDSLVKTAEEDDLNPEMTARVSEMLNISLTRNFMKSASDRTSTFPLADCAVALRRVFAGEPQVKTASAVPGADWGSMTVSRTAESEHSFFKVAREEDRGQLRDHVCQAEGAKAVLRDHLSKSAQSLVGSQARTLDLYSGLISHFRRSDNLSHYEDFENQCYSEYGVKVAHYLDSIFEHLPPLTIRGDQEFAKKAFYFQPGQANRMFDSLMEEVEVMNKHAGEADICRLELNDFEEKIDCFYRMASGISKQASVEGLLDFKKKADFSLIHNPLESAISAHNQQAASTYGKGLEVEQESMYRRPKDETDMEIDNVRRQSILADLMSNDDVISGQDPSHVESAYNTLLQISPKSTLHREVVRSVLRNATAQQAIDPFTAKQLADLEGQHLKNDALVKNKPLPSGV